MDRIPFIESHDSKCRGSCQRKGEGVTSLLCLNILCRVDEFKGKRCMLIF